MAKSGRNQVVLMVQLTTIQTRKRCIAYLICIYTGGEKAQLLAWISCKNMGPRIGSRLRKFSIRREKKKPVRNYHI